MAAFNYFIVNKKGDYQDAFLLGFLFMVYLILQI